LFFSPPFSVTKTTGPGLRSGAGWRPAMTRWRWTCSTPASPSPCGWCAPYRARWHKPAAPCPSMPWRAAWSPGKQPWPLGVPSPWPPGLEPTSAGLRKGPWVVLL